MTDLSSSSKRRTARKSNATDLSSLLSAVNEASARASVLWLSFLTFMAYLTMTVGAVTHEDLLTQKAIRLPVLNVELPMVGFFWIAPIFFLLFHFYLFLQIVILVRKTTAFDERLRSAIAREHQEERRSLLDSFLVVQFRAGPDEERNKMTGRLLRAVGFITLVVLPILLLLQFQLTFLPYHDGDVTWLHRIAILIDLRLCWVFWLAIASPKRNGRIEFPEFTFWRSDWFSQGNFWDSLRSVVSRFGSALRYGFRHQCFGLCISLGLIFTSIFVFAYKDEPIAKLAQTPYIEIRNNSWYWEMRPIADVLLQSSVDMVEGRPRTWFSNTLVVPEKKLVDDQRVDFDFPSLSLRGRNLSGAILVGSDLRNADFTGANLNDARFDRALLSRAKFRCATSYDSRPKQQRWPKDECTWLQRATFMDAKLQAADFDRARMHGAILFGANLMGAQFTGTQLQGAMLNNAQLQAASIIGARLNKAYLNGASLVGARISQSDLQGVLIGDTHFQLTYLQHDKSKIRWIRNLILTPALADRAEVREAAISAENDSIVDQFKFTEILEARILADLEWVEPGFDIETRVAKLRQEFHCDDGGGQQDAVLRPSESV